jgi:hypothetical protein
VKEALVAYFKVLFHNLPGGSKETYKILKAANLWARIKPRASKHEPSDG